MRKTSLHEMTKGGDVYQDTLRYAEMILMMLQSDLGRECWRGPMGPKIQCISTIGETRKSLRTVRAERIWIEGVGFRIQLLANLLPEFQHSWWRSGRVGPHGGDCEITEMTLGVDFTPHENIPEGRDDETSQEDCIEADRHYHRQSIPQMISTDDFEMWGQDFTHALKELIQDLRAMLQPNLQPEDWKPFI
jgi:hypothetical protein